MSITSCRRSETTKINGSLLWAVVIRLSMLLGRNGRVDLIVREAVPIGKPDTLARIRAAGGVLHASTEIRSATFAGERMRLSLSNGEQIDCSLAIVQIGFLASRETFERL